MLVTKRFHLKNHEHTVGVLQVKKNNILGHDSEDHFKKTVGRYTTLSMMHVLPDQLLLLI